MARQRPKPGRSAAADPAQHRRRWSSAREAHLAQIAAFTFLSPSRPRRSATKLPAALRYAAHLPAGRAVRILLLIAVPAYAAVQVWQGAALASALVLAALLAVVILALSTYRVSVGNHGISFDIAGLRQASSFGFVPLHAVREVRVGPLPQDWSRAPVRGSWWPGRARVNVLHADQDGVPRAFHLWVSDPDGFGTALLGRPFSQQDLIPYQLR